MGVHDVRLSPVERAGGLPPDPRSISGTMKREEGEARDALP
jgi:hypothetical protein